jgi:hypothetical protein
MVPGDGGEMSHPLGGVRARAPVWCALLCAACSAGGSDSTGGPPGECNVELTDTLPESGTEACFNSAVEFEVAGDDVTGTVGLADAGGADVPGSTSSVENANGVTLVFTPQAPLAPSASYTATLDYCLGTETLSFTTSAYGSPLDDAGALVGGVYVVDIRNPALARFNKPKGVSAILQPQLSRLIALQVLAPTTATAITMRLAVLDEAGKAQDACVPTVDFEQGTLDGAAFQIGPKDVTLFVAGDAVDIGNLVATGSFAPDGASFGCAGFTGLVDTRPLVPLLGQKDSPPDFICELIGGYGAECVACSDGEALCLDLEVDHASGIRNDDLPIAPITDKDVAANPDCEKK